MAQDLQPLSIKEPIDWLKIPTRPIVALDGLSGSGTTSVAKLVAAELKLPILSTGSLYRLITRQALTHSIDHTDPEACATLAKELMSGITVMPEGMLRLGWSEDLLEFTEEELHSPEISGMVAFYAAIPTVRAAVVSVQERFAETGAVIEGRDICNIFPDARIRMFLTAADAVRYERIASGRSQEVADQMRARDKLDQEREAAPAKPAKGARLWDTTSIKPQKTAEFIIHNFRKRTPATS